MDRFIDEQDASRDRSSSPTNYHSLIFGGENKKGNLVNPSLIKLTKHNLIKLNLSYPLLKAAYLNLIFFFFLPYHCNVIFDVCWVELSIKQFHFFFQVCRYTPERTSPRGQFRTGNRPPSPGIPPRRHSWRRRTSWRHRTSWRQRSHSTAARQTWPPTNNADLSRQRFLVSKECF